MLISTLSFHSEASVTIVPARPMAAARVRLRQAGNNDVYAVSIVSKWWEKGKKLRLLIGPIYKQKQVEEARCSG